MVHALASLTVYFHRMGWGVTLPLFPYGDRFRKQRRLMWQHFNPQAVVSFRPKQEEKSRYYLNSLLDSPEDFLKHVNR